MLKKIFTNKYIIAGLIVFLLLFFIGVFGLGFSWGESLFASAVLAVVGIGVIGWKEEMW